MKYEFKSKNQIFLSLAFLFIFSIALTSALPSPDAIYTFNSSGVYTPNFWEDLSGNGNNLTNPNGNSSIYVIDDPLSVGYKRFLINLTGPAQYSFDFDDVYTNESDFAISFYTKRNSGEIYNLIGRLYVSAYATGNTTPCLSEYYLQFRSTNLILGDNVDNIFFDHTASDDYKHYLIRFHQNQTLLYVNGVNVVNGTITGSTCSNIDHFKIKSMNYLYSSLYEYHFGGLLYGPTRIYYQTFTDEDAKTVSSYDEVKDEFKLVYPFENNMVVQRDLTTNKADVDVVYTATMGHQVNITLGPYHTIQTITESGNITYTFNNIPKGSYNLTITDLNNSQSESKLNYGVGDIWMITGQSNTHRGSASKSNWTYSNYTLPSKKYPISIAQSGGFTYSPSYQDNYGSTIDNDASNFYNNFIPMVWEISAKEDVPIMVIHAGVGGTNLSFHYEGVGNYSLYNLMKTYTNGKMDAIALYFWQGETDRIGNNPTYKTEFQEYINQVFNLYNIKSNKFLTIPTSNYGGGGTIGPCYSSSVLYNANYGQYAVAKTDSRVIISAEVGDIDTTPFDYCIHFADYQDGLPAKMRITQGALGNIYGYSSYIKPKITRFEKDSNVTIKVYYNTNIRIADYQNNPGTKAYGFEFFEDKGLWNRASDFDDTDINTTTINGNVLTITFNKDISSVETMSYARTGSVIYNKTIVRSSTSIYTDSYRYSSPTLSVFDLEVSLPKSCSSNELIGYRLILIFSSLAVLSFMIFYLKEDGYDIKTLILVFITIIVTVILWSAIGEIIVNSCGAIHA